jgi:serine/threonine-protein kinase
LIQEAEILAAFDNPPVAPLFEIGERQGRPFFGMTLVVDYLAKGLSDQPEPRHEIVSLVERLLGALGHAHRDAALRRKMVSARVLIEAHMETSIGRVRIPGRVVPPFESVAGEDAEGVLGETLAEGLSGRPPGSDPEVLGLKCQDRTPGRPASAARLATEVERWLRGEPVQEHTLGPLSQLLLRHG